MKSARDHAPNTDAATPKSAPPSVTCDLCGWPMSLPAHCIEQGEILGLLVCTLCVEETLEAQNHERTCQAH